MMKTGRTSSVSSVSCHCRKNIAASVVTSTMTLLTMLPKRAGDRGLRADHVVVES